MNTLTLLKGGINTTKACKLITVSKAMKSTTQKVAGASTSQLPVRPDYKDMLCKSKHHFAEMIEEDSPFIFMNQDKFQSNSVKTEKFKLDSDMKLNFFRAYSHFMEGLSEYSQSKAEESSFFDTHGFTLAKKNEKTIQEADAIRSDLLAISETNLIEELEDSLINDMAQDQCHLELINLAELKETLMSDEEHDVTDLPDEIIPPHEINLLDIRFTMGSHIDRE